MNSIIQWMIAQLKHMNQYNPSLRNKVQNNIQVRNRQDGRQYSIKLQNDQRNIPHKMFIMQDQYVIQQQRSSTGALIMNQIISVHVGGTGVKVGLSFWDQLTRNIELNVKNEGEKMYTERFFYEKQKGYQIPRAIFLDTDCLSKNLITNTKGNFDKRLIVGGDGMSCGNNYAIGMMSKQGGDLHKLFEEAVRREAERCDRVNGFIVTGAPAGGAGGGLGAGAMVKLQQIMQDSIIQNFAIYSGNWQQQQKCLAAPQIYNILLNLNRVGSQVDLMYILQNNSVQKLLSAKGILHSNFKDINEYYGQCLNQHINSYISPGFLNMDQRKRATNLVPYYSLRCICASLSTKGSSQCIESALSLRNKLMHHPTLSDSRLFSFNIHVKDNFAYEQQITNRVFSYMNRNNAQFLDWLSPSPLSISIGRSDSFKDNSAWILSNGRNNVLWLNEIGKAFKKQYRRRAFIHHYIEEGLDQTQFLQAQQSCKDLFQQYNPYELSGEVQ